MAGKLEMEPVAAKDSVGTGGTGTAYVIPFTTDANNPLGKSVQIRMDGNIVAEFSSTGLSVAAGYPVTPTVLTPALVVIPSITTAARQALVAPVAGETYFDTDREQVAFYSGSAWILITAEAE